MRKTLTVSRIVTFGLALLLFAMVFMPFATATPDYKEYLLENPDRMHTEEIGMTNKDAVNTSLFDFVRIYTEAYKQGYQKEQCIVGIVLIAIFALFALLTALLSITKKPIGAIIFNLLTMGVFWMNHFDFADRGVIPSSKYDWGIINHTVYIIGVLLIASAIWLLVEKVKFKKLAKATVQEEA